MNISKINECRMRKLKRSINSFIINYYKNTKYY